MDCSRTDADRVLTGIAALGLIDSAEHAEILGVLAEDFPFAAAVDRTASVHAHIKVDDVDALPHDALVGLGHRPENAEPGYIKYATGAGVHFIFSSIPVAQDDGIPGAVTLAKPFLDHLGIDLRDESDATRAVFDGVVGRAAELGWREVTQEGPVHCCHTEVQGKHWVYPPEEWPGGRRPIEFAFGQLSVFEKAMGCDLRPIDPGHPLAPAPGTACCGGAPEAG
ncbi:hypothetical protein [Streptomyces clavuligerus]|uniref:Uncharacterized protein n=1 Tax=Streptomyces clavuligerus TaxID=1901 RepID=B5GRL0_STRCL|nr:hypothetical protein [Streptomyces clavuligerus]ANW17459.1 hypothetical protein BB341_04075 [Streptomyces clavuligerus]AXU12006.1 hypothetical protein D1794_04245 [Streptomyces clavuligerus]EDY48956.1 hypothetical protein SSCG_01984 [Streptomyces clavuligerus]EFG10049.1 Hypothetical protein SCLAV_4976 [Streptomyces clavuligerus]MBY6301859.1 hypothetical protein [Streptomyces clavuligerus]